MNLPPGCTDRDISRAAGDYQTNCEACGWVFLAYELNEDGFCEECAKKQEDAQDD
jgi:hypothetical protein